jgi:anti-sigma factor RsiW
MVQRPHDDRARGAPDLTDAGFPLAGGRIDVIDGKAAPTLVYRHDQHVISVTVTPARGISSGQERRDGTTIYHWRAGDLDYWAASDLEERELRRFEDAYRAQAGQR